MNLRLVDLPLEAIPVSLGQLRALYRLCVSRVPLREVPASLGALKALTSLAITRTHLDRLPAALGELTNLTKLDLSYNRLSALPPSLGNLTRLETLDLHENRLTRLPPTVARLQALRELQLRENSFMHFPAPLLELTRLQKLDLSFCQIERLPRAIVRLTTPRIWLDHNRITHLPYDVPAPRLHQVKALLDHNPLEGLYGCWPELVEEDLNFGTLDEVLAQFAHLPPLARACPATRLGGVTGVLRALPPRAARGVGAHREVAGRAARPRRAGIENPAPASPG